MRSAVRRSAVFCAILALVGGVGCQTTGSYMLSGMGLQDKPLAIALVLDGKPDAALAPLNPFPSYAALQKRLSETLDRPVAIDPCFGFQAQQGLESGWYGLAFVTPTQYSRLPNSAELRVLAAPVDSRGRVMWPAVLVVPQDSEIEAVADLKGKKVAFGPREDARTHQAAVRLLEESGLRETDLNLEVLPLPGLKHMPDTKSIAQSVINRSSDAGFVDEADWEALPVESDDERRPSRDRLRVIARTMAVPEELIVAGPSLEPETARAVQDFLLSAAQEHPDVLAPLGVAGFQTVGESAIAACRTLWEGAPYEMPTPSADDEQADDETPSET
jgi:ABC-type phosphate/phosphonate transport system substrate-binding protein